MIEKNKVMQNPIEKFKESWQQAKTLNDPNAAFCSLATVSTQGQPSVRTLVLRDVTEESFIVFFNDTSPKWDQLQQSKQFEILIFWPSLMVQYRIRGIFKEMAIEEMKWNWNRKPYHAKLVDHFYTRYQPQSSVISSREKFLEGIETLKQEFPDDKKVPFPETIKGISFKATYLEEWCESKDRLHERHLYILKGDQWSQQVLVP